MSDTEQGEEAELTQENNPNTTEEETPADAPSGGVEASAEDELGNADSAEDVGSARLAPEGEAAETTAEPGEIEAGAETAAEPGEVEAEVADNSHAGPDEATEAEQAEAVAEANQDEAAAAAPVETEAAEPAEAEVAAEPVQAEAEAAELDEAAAGQTDRDEAIEAVEAADQEAAAEPIERDEAAEPTERDEAAEPTERDEAAEPTEREEAAAEPTEREEAAAEPTEREEAAAEPTEREEAAAEPTEREEAAAEPTEREEAAAEPTDQEEAPAEPTDRDEAAEPTDRDEAPAEPTDRDEAAEPTDRDEAAAEQPDQEAAFESVEAEATAAMATEAETEQDVAVEDVQPEAEDVAVAAVEEQATERDAGAHSQQDAMTSARADDEGEGASARAEYEEADRPASLPKHDSQGHDASYHAAPTHIPTGTSFEQVGDYRLEQPVVVKFMVDRTIVSDLQSVLPLGTSVAQIKQQLALRVNTGAESLRIHYHNQELSNDHLLAITDAAPHSELTLEVYTADNKPVLLKSRLDASDSQRDAAGSPLRRPRSSLNVLVKYDDGSSKELLTKIERHNLHKPNLGGLRDRKTGLLFNHAGTQTNPRPKPPPLAPLCTRDTQTVKIRTKVQQTFKDVDTQMTGIGVYVANVTDKLVAPKAYETADEYQRRRERNAITIQKWIRRWLAQRYVRRLMADRQARLEWEKEEELRKLRDKEARQRREFERRMNPKTKEDFDLLYSYLESWRQEELLKINEKFSSATRKAYLCKLLDQETLLLTNIERQKQSALREARVNNIKKLLGSAASPKKWYARDGKLTQMETPYIQRAKELKEIYECINMKYLTRDERLDVLLTLKHTVKEHDCDLTREICDLVDREADLLMREVSDSNLDGLRKRISTLFLQYVKTPMFNPEISRLLRVPQDPLQLRKNIYYCLSCNRYLPSTDFPLSTSSQTTGRCRSCIRLDNQGRVRQDVSHFRQLLIQLRKTEQAYQDGSKIAFLIQENDLRYLVENIWGGQSVLSAWPDLYDLVIIRWDKRDEWSPWNCILLTREEAAAHMKIEDIKLAYRKEFINKVHRRHTLAHAYFAKLPEMAEHLRFKESTQRPVIAGIGLASA